MEPNQNQEEHNHTGLKRGVLALVVLLVIIFAIYLVLGTGDRTPGQQGTGITTKENVIVEKTDLTLSQANKLPAGMPSFVPVETGDITESYSMTYPDREVVLYTVGYLSSRTISQKYDEYIKFMKDNSYQINQSGLDAKIATLYSSKDGDDFSVVFSQKSGKTYVQVNYLERLQ